MLFENSIVLYLFSTVDSHHNQFNSITAPAFRDFAKSGKPSDVPPMLPPILFFRPVRYESKIATPTMTPMTVIWRS